MTQEEELVIMPGRLEPAFPSYGGPVRQPLLSASCGTTRRYLRRALPPSGRRVSPAAASHVRTLLCPHRRVGRGSTRGRWKPTLSSASFHGPAPASARHGGGQARRRRHPALTHPGRIEFSESRQVRGSGEDRMRGGGGLEGATARRDPGHPVLQARLRIDRVIPSGARIWGGMGQHYAGLDTPRQTPRFARGDSAEPTTWACEHRAHSRWLAIGEAMTPVQLVVARPPSPRPAPRQARARGQPRCRHPRTLASRPETSSPGNGSGRRGRG